MVTIMCVLLAYPRNLASMPLAPGLTLPMSAASVALHIQSHNVGTSMVSRLVFSLLLAILRNYAKLRKAHGVRVLAIGLLQP
jgi:hypothetical protein